MEVFETLLNDQRIGVAVTFHSHAVKYGSIVFSLKNEQDNWDFIPLENREDTTVIDKKEAITHKVFEAVIHFALDAVQLPHKQEIIANTQLTYLFADKDNQMQFSTVFSENQEEYHDGGSNVFKVTKLIRIRFTEGVVERLQGQDAIVTTET